jgi:hypothetical protein
MEDELTSLLVSNGVDMQVIEHLTAKGCLTIKKYANWVDSRSELQSLVLDKVKSGALASDTASLAGLKQAWREAGSWVAKSLKRTCDGLPEEDRDDPLPSHIQQDIDKRFMTVYSWELNTKERGSDSLLGRVKREFDKATPTMFSVLRVMCVAQANRRGAAKRHRVSAEIEVSVADDLHIVETPDASRLRIVLSQYQVLANTWSLAGNFDAESHHVKPKERTKYVHWQQACRYIQLLRERTEHLMDNYGEESVIAYLLRCEETVRGKAIELARSNERPMAFGHALLIAAKEEANVWSDNKEMLSKASSHHAREPRDPKPARPQAGASGDSAVNRPQRLQLTSSSKATHSSSQASRHASVENAATCAHSAGGL